MTANPQPAPSAESPERLTAPNEQYWPELDGLRALAVSLVLLLHTEIPWARGGGIGVDVFFTLSGFLITTVLLGEYERTAGIRLARFYLRRLLRLYPALVVVVAVSIAVTPILDPAARKQAYDGAVVALTYSLNWFKVHATDHRYGMLAHTWSLAVEEQFYLIWPIALLVALRRWGMKGAFVVSVAGVAVTIAESAVLFHYFGWKRIYFGTDARFPQLLIGASAAIAYARGVIDARLWRVIRPAAVCGLALIALFTVFDPPRAVYAYVGFWAVAVATAAVVLVLVDDPSPVMRRAFGGATVVALGRVSYGVYLWHWPVISVLNSLSPALDPYVRFAIAAPVSIGAALLSFRWVERPFLRLKKRLA
jgi:peptidoglycan/LPS O-acetylase OafA/YrhL